MHPKAEHFVNSEVAFHLGDLLTEQPHPATIGLDERTRNDPAAGVRALLEVDQDLLKIAHVVRSGEWQQLVELMHRTISGDGRICFSGCGATGRLAILLESMWRKFWADTGDAARMADRVLSIMTGGDYALVKSVEFFEDYQTFGRQQVRELGLTRGDLLVAITEGGETSSVIGTAWQALDQGAAVAFVCNNPMDLLCRKVERSRKIIEHPDILKLDLTTGPMGIAGSTRMQATSSELYYVGMALETALHRWQAANSNHTTAEPWLSEPTALLRNILDAINRDDVVRQIADLVVYESGIYSQGGAITYFADDMLLDIFTDTTERTPTFTLPPFRAVNEPDAPRPWAFAKDPFRSTPEAWQSMLQRGPRCLDWSIELYRKMGAADRIRMEPPAIGLDDLMKFQVGAEPDPSRRRTPVDAAVAVFFADELDRMPISARRDLDARLARFSDSKLVTFGKGGVDLDLTPTSLRLAHHLSVKLALNTLSTATMAHMGRTVSNWMAYVKPSNKKLIDRATRLISTLAEIPYAEACSVLYDVIDESNTTTDAPVLQALDRLAAR